MISLITYINEELSQTKLYASKSRLYKGDVPSFIQFQKAQRNNLYEYILDKPIKLVLTNFIWRDGSNGKEYNVTDSNTISYISILRNGTPYTFNPEIFYVLFENKNKKVVSPSKEFSWCDCLTFFEQIEQGNVTGNIKELLELVKNKNFDKKTNSIIKKLCKMVEKEDANVAKQLSNITKSNTNKSQPKIKVNNGKVTKSELITIVKQFKQNNIELIEDELEYLRRGHGKYKEFIWNMADRIEDEYKIDFKKSHVSDEEIWDIIQKYIN